MQNNSRYQTLFEPVKIGPVTAKNRFYQVPHCNGMGFDRPQTQAKMREMKAEGGWAVVCTEENMIHPSSDASPIPQCRLWDEEDRKCLELIVEAIHRHGALAGTELVHHGLAEGNLFSRLTPLAPSHQSIKPYHPVQARQMDKRDIREFRRWHRDAVLRAKRAGVDIIYVYASHDLSLIQHFLSRRRNHRSDEYGGTLENRARLLKEVLLDTKEAVGDTCAVALRLAVHEPEGCGGIDTAEARDLVEMLSTLPDLWDVNVSDVPEDVATSRFAQEGHEESYIAFVKRITATPVVGVGRFTSPDTMASQVKRGILDFIGAARPSIADPFLPKKIQADRLEEIRECIGCNICIAGNFTATPMRCTQNPTVGEEWRRGWHPERVKRKKSDKRVLVVGAGPAGLEATHILGERGYAVTLAESRTMLGGRVLEESQLPGLAAWSRVIHYRDWKIKQMPNVEVYLDSRLNAQHILEFGFQDVLLATGATWRTDGFGRANNKAINGWDQAHVYSANDVLAGKNIKGSILVFDDDHYYLGSAIAHHLKTRGHPVVLVTPASEVASWSKNTAEQHKIQKQLMTLGVDIRTSRNINRIGDCTVDLACIYTGAFESVKADAVVMVTCRTPNDALYQALTRQPKALEKAGIDSVQAIGDCYCPGIIAAAVHDGYRAAIELDDKPQENVPFLRERIDLLSSSYEYK